MGRAFSIKISSREHLSHISISEGRDGVVVEGDIGEVQDISLIESLMLEIKATHGTLRFDVTKPELEQVLKTRCED